MRRSYDLDANAWVRRAASTLSSEVEPGEIDPRPGHWSGPAPSGAKRRLPFFSLLLIGVLAEGVASLLHFHTSFPIALVPIMVAVLYMVHKESTATKRDLALIEDEDDKEICLVRVTIRTSGHSVGVDRGVVWFSDQRLFFSGHRTSFVLGGQDLIPRLEWSNLKLPGGLKELSDSMVALRHPDGPLFVSFLPLNMPNGKPEIVSEMRFRKRLAEFRKNTPFAHALRQWPPGEGSSA